MSPGVDVFGREAAGSYPRMRALLPVRHWRLVVVLR